MRNITIEGAIHSCHNGDYRASKQHLDEVFEYISIPSLQFQSLYNLDKQDCYLSAKCYNFYIFASALQDYIPGIVMLFDDPRITSKKCCKSELYFCLPRNRDSQFEEKTKKLKSYELALKEYEKSDDYEKLEPRSPKFPPCILESIDRRFAIESRLEKDGYRPYDIDKLAKSIEKAVKWRKTVEKAMTRIYGQQL